MKRISLIAAIFLICSKSFGQFNITQNIGSSNTLVQVPANGGIRGGLINRIFQDTISANLSQLDFYDGSQVKTLSPNALWWRDSTNRAWIQIIPGGGGSGVQGWEIGGNFNWAGSATGNEALGWQTSVNKGINLTTNGVTNVSLNSGGLTLKGSVSDTTLNKPMVYNTSDKSWNYGYWYGGSGGGGGSTITSLGSGYAVGVTGTNNVKSLSAGWGAILDSATTGQVGVTVDSNAVKTVMNGNYWKDDGNSGTTAGTNFIGTTDNVGLMFKTNNVQSGYIEPDRSNVSLGQYAMSNSISGDNNAAFGHNSMGDNISGDNNAAIGLSSLGDNQSGSFNTAVGGLSLGSTTSGSNNIGLGYLAGFYNTGGARLYINSVSRGSLLNDTTQSIIYGAQDATAANQRLYLNSKVIMPYIPSGVGTKALRIDASGNVTSADTTAAGGWNLNGNTVGSEKWIGTIDGYDLPLKANNTEFQRLTPYTGTETGKWGYVINSNYVTSPANFAAQITSNGAGTTGTPVAGGISLSVTATDFSRTFNIPTVWPASVLPTEDYRAVGIKTAANNGLILAQEVATLVPSYWARLWVEYDFNTRIATIKIQNSLGVTTLATSSALASISVGDSVACIFDWDYNIISATITNLNTAATTTVSTGFSAPNYAPTIYNPCTFFPLTTNPTVLQSLQVYIDAYKRPDFNFVGHSVLQGYGGVTRAELVPELIRDFMPQYKIQVDAMGSMKTSDGMFWIDEIQKINGKYTVIMFGANDAGVSDASFYAAYRALRDSIVQVGSIPIHFGQLPQTGFNFTARNDSLKTLYESLGDTFIDIFPLLKNGSGYDYLPYYDVGDGIHPSAAGDSLIASQFMLAIASLIEEPVNQDKIDFAKILKLNGQAFYETQQIFNSNRALVDKGYVDSVVTNHPVSAVTSFAFTDGSGFDGTVTSSTTTPTLALTTTVSDGQLMLSNSGAISGSANLKYGTTYRELTLGGSTPTAGWTNISGAIQGGGATIMVGQSTDMWHSSNAFFNTGWRYYSNGFAANIGVFQQDVQLRAAASANAGDAVTWVMPIKATYNSGGIAGIGGDITTTGGSITGATIGAYPTRVGIGQSVLIGDITTTPDASAQLQMNSTSKGFLPPRMTAAQASAISSPAEGLLVYVTNTNGTFTAKGWWGWDGAAWYQF